MIRCCVKGREGDLTFQRVRRRVLDHVITIPPTTSLSSFKGGIAGLKCTDHSEIHKVREVSVRNLYCSECICTPQVTRRSMIHSSPVVAIHPVCFHMYKQSSPQKPKTPPYAPMSNAPTIRKEGIHSA